MKNLSLILLISLFLVSCGSGSSGKDESETENESETNEIAETGDSDRDGVINSIDECPGTVSGALVDAVGCEIVTSGSSGGSSSGASSTGGISSSGGSSTGGSSSGGSSTGGSSSGSSSSGTGSGSSGGDLTIDSYKPLFDETTELEPINSFVRSDGVVVTRIGDRGRDRHAKDITNSDHYDHYLAHYWQYRTARIQLEDFVPNGESRIRATFISETELGAREFRVWYWGLTTTGQFHFNPQKEEEKVNPLESGVVYVGSGTWDNDFVKISESGDQHLHYVDIVNKWQNGGVSRLI